MTFGANQSTATLDLTIVDDLAPEGAETVQVTLVDGSGYAVGA